jgi:hypothetical protein
VRPVADRPHHLVFTVEASNWEVAERAAIRRIRGYTNENKRGRDRPPDDEVLRNAEFWAEPRDDSEHDRGCKMWLVTVRVDV